MRPCSRNRTIIPAIGEDAHPGESGPAHTTVTAVIEDQPWIALLVGLGAMTPFTVQAILYARTQRRHREWVRTTAVVSQTRTTPGENNTFTYTARYGYADADGRPRRGLGEIDHDATPGAELTILYDPEDSSRSQVWRRVGAGHWIAGTLGFLLFAVGVSGVVRSVVVLVTGATID